MDRRGFLKTVGAVGAVVLAPGSARGEQAESAGDPYGVLVDMTSCIGCRYCEQACAEAHGLPPPDLTDRSVLTSDRGPSETEWTAASAHETDEGTVVVKHQCMHCVQPACASACLTQAMKKTPEGPVVWRADKCMGCRYCMVSCPFDVPRFEYHSANPKIQKCNLCAERLKEGEQPACVENCMGDALLFGRRSELIQEAHRRLAEDPDSYHSHIYGEHEAGGTSWLYLSPVPFEQLGFKTDLGSKPYPEYTKGFLYGVPVVLTLWPAFLLALSKATKPAPEAPEEEATDERPQAGAVGAA